MSNDKTAIMPSAVEMTQRLIEVDDELSFVAHLYPLICRELAGRQITVTGVLAGLYQAIYDYIESAGLPRLMLAQFSLKMPDLIEAVCPTELPEFRADVLEIWQLACQLARG